MSPVVGHVELRQLARDIVTGLGAPADDARAVADHLVDSNLAGHDSHGVLMLPHYATMVAEERIDPRAGPEVVHDAGAVLALDGHFGWGQAIAEHAGGLAAERAREHGVACVVARNTGHVGRLGAYTERLGEEGIASIMIVTSQGGDLQMAPFGGRDRRLTNNPISVGAPGGAGGPVAVDMALSVMAGGKVVLAGARGERLPRGAIVDAEGAPSTDPADFFADGRIAGGLLLPVGGHKGYGLIVLAEILAGLLSGGGTARADAPDRSSNAFCLVAVDAAPLVPAEDYAAQIQALREWIKSSRPAPGFDEVLLPGEAEERAARRRRAEGIEIEESTWEALLELNRRAR